MSNPAQNFVALKGINLTYNEFKALNNVDLDIDRGEIHAIVGEHGAGKSSLAATMSGLLKPQSGTILILGQSVFPYTLKSAQLAGVRMVYQQSCLNDYFSVAENLFYSAPQSTRMGFYNQGRVEELADNYLSQFGFSIDPRVQLRSLSLSERTVVEILKNLYAEPCLLILDEALEKLSTKSFDKIVSILHAMRDQNRSVITITHRIDDVFHLADKVTVLKTGSRMITERVDNINKLNLIRMAYTQVGREPSYVKLDAEFYQILKYNEAILQHLPVNILVVDESLTIKMVNAYCVKNYTLADNEYFNTPLIDLLSDDKEAYSLIEKSVHDHEAKTFFNVELTIHGIRSVNNIKTYPVFDGYTVIGTIIIIEDMTEYDTLQKHLILAEKLASVGLLAAGVAHEINNPLEIISNYLSYLRYSHPNSDIQESVDKIHGEIESISKIVGNLVMFSGNQHSDWILFDINEVFVNILELLKYNAEYKHILIRFHSEAPTLWVRGDKDQMKQVILNLVKNSFEAMPSGGEIRIQTGEVTHNEQSSVQIVFEDTGPGIDADELTTVFLPFFSSKPGGKNQLGLGLSISYRIIESFGGDIEVRNLPVGGCGFTIFLPNPN